MSDISQQPAKQGSVVLAEDRGRRVNAIRGRTVPGTTYHVSRNDEALLKKDTQCLISHVAGCWLQIAEFRITVKPPQG